MSPRGAAGYPELELQRRIGFREGELAIRQRVEAVISGWGPPAAHWCGEGCVPCAMEYARREIERAIHAR